MQPSVQSAVPITPASDVCVPDAPDEIVVGPYTIRVNREAAACFAAECGLESHCWAKYDKRISTILLPSDISRERAKVALIHEALHALFDTYEIDLPEYKIQEDVCTRLSPVLLDLLVRNPKLAAYLTS